MVLDSFLLIIAPLMLCQPDGRPDGRPDGLQAVEGGPAAPAAAAEPGPSTPDLPLGRRPPEWARMMLAILRDEPFDEDKGWWSPGAALHGWDWLRESWDTDRNGRIEPVELGDRDLFERLDRDEDGAIAAPDFGRGAAGPPSAAGAALFRRLDTNGNDRVSWDELSWFFQQADRLKRGFITPLDLDRALPDLSGGDRSRPAGEEASRDQLPSRWRLLWLFFTRQLGSFGEGPGPGEAAPDVRLLSLETGERLSVASLLGKRPVVLVFGSFT